MKSASDFRLSESDDKKYADFKKIVQYRKYECEPRATTIEQKQALLFLEKIAKVYPQTVERDEFIFRGYRELANLQGASEQFRMDCREKYMVYGQSVISQLDSRFHSEIDREKKFQTLDEMWGFCGYSKEYRGQLGHARFAELVGDFMQEGEKCHVFPDLAPISKDGCYALAYLKAASDERISARVYAKIKDKSAIARLSKLTGLSNNLHAVSDMSR